MRDIDKTPLEGSRNVFMHERSPSLVCNYAFTNPLDHYHVSPTCAQASISPEYSLDAPVDSPKIYHSNVDLGYEDNEFNVLGGNVDDYASFGYFKGYDPSIDPYCVCIED